MKVLYQFAYEMQGRTFLQMQKWLTARLGTDSANTRHLEIEVLAYLWFLILFACIFISYFKNSLPNSDSELQIIVDIITYPYTSLREDRTQLASSNVSSTTISMSSIFICWRHSTYTSSQMQFNCFMIGPIRNWNRDCHSSGRITPICFWWSPYSAFPKPLISP
jgi:hypothetical protein